MRSKTKKEKRWCSSHIEQPKKSSLARVYARTYSNFQLFAFTTFTKSSVEQSYSDDYDPIRNKVRQTNRKQR